MADGSTLFPEHIQNIRERARILAMAVEFGQKPVGIPQTLDPDGKIKLNTFLDMLQHDGVQPVLFVPPYHPQAYKLMLNSEKSRIIVEEQKYFEALAKRRGLTLVGSYNPSDLALTETDFHDGSHPRADAIRRIFVGRVSLAKIVGTTPATGTANRMELIGIDNANGLETVNGRPFFWIGGGDSCLSLHCATNGTALLGFCASAGPSLPETSERLLLLRTESSFSRLIRINDNPNVEVTFPVRHGLNRVYLTPLDKPTAKTLSNGDPRTLLVGVSGLSVKLLPDAAVIREADQFTLRLTTGWYGVEHSGEDWWAWSTGRGQISVFSKKAGSVILTGALGSASHPNIIDVFVNGIKADTWSPSEYGPTGIPPVHFALNIGENIIEFVSQKPAVTLPTDKRLLAIMVKNLGILEN
ncbi:MAG: hypothetical protein WCH84_09190 [Verrucomicrobiota bacterium]